MKYLKVFTDFAEKMELYGDAERGRLFTAMLEYAKTGIDPELKGNERFLWATARADIDRQAASYKNKVDAAEKARALIGSDNRDNQTQSDANRLKTAQDKDKDKDKEKEKKKKGFSTSSDEDVCPSGDGHGDVQTVIDAWNSLGLNPIRGVAPGSARKQILGGRLNQDGLPLVLQAIENVRNSAFLNGQNNRGFSATFDWFIKPSNFQKVLDGNYNNRRSPAVTSTADRLALMIEEGVFDD